VPRTGNVLATKKLKDRPLSVVFLPRRSLFIAGMDLNNDSKNRPYIANAGPIRNQEMVDGGAAMCLAFHRAISLSKGTKDCGRSAIETGIPTYLIDSQRAEQSRLLLIMSRRG
jgi:hypothetical protein